MDDCPHGRSAKAEKDAPTLKEDLEAALAALGIAGTDGVIEEFDLLSISLDAENLERETAKKLKERMAGFAGLLEDLLQPDSGLAAMSECSFLDEQELGAVAATYRALMRTLRKFTAADLDGTRAAYTRFIIDGLAAWHALRPELARIVATLERGWDKEQPLHSDRGYFG